MFIHKNIKKKWLFLLFPLTLLSLPIYYISLCVLDESIIILNTIIIAYYTWKTWRNKVNIMDIEIIPVIQMIELLYLTNMDRGTCIVAA
ncbi:hypothetical protein Shell_1178 [Staphylothermus hellenicus DSM 12710]|uniref:Uncharacterized protein n=1 Tax=Staphylothermus hellenicus (strain DSM 12710 / JCM 10830 / BK20S6-10-b1 / P8) TaxID=591019 RepID=D7D932_STAHD|nr:hypothetical protein Shell_1178 [Staphylothermus hellenicus DSM 12710]